MSSGQEAQAIIKGGQHRLDPVRAGTATADPLANGSTHGVKRSRCPLLTEWMLLRLNFPPQTIVAAPCSIYVPWKQPLWRNFPCSTNISTQRCHDVFPSCTKLPRPERVPLSSLASPRELPPTHHARKRSVL